MRLKSIKLAGFKSFVDPTTVNFPSNLCAVVGPNGCGKSNVIDAVRWVMGESSAKNLRGEHMTDVIFNGSGGRKPVGQASIELIFDNSDGTLLGEYAGFSEVSIKRKVSRDSQNIYYLNGAKCRRRDITDIFLGTGLGPRSYAIIEQGMISRLIESKPEELRVYIEEAAGISKYKERRRDTENRIRRTQENLERLTDIRDELERQLSRLERQAQAAEKYAEFKKEERKLRAQVQTLEYQSLDEHAKNRQQIIRDLEIQMEAFVTERVSKDTQIEKCRIQHEEIRLKFEEIQGRSFKIGTSIAGIEADIRNAEERKRQYQTDLERAEREARENDEGLRIDQEKAETWESELLEVEPELALIQAAEESSGDLLQASEEAMQSWQGEWDTFNQSAAEPRQRAEVQQSRIQHFEQVQQRLLMRVEKLKEESSSLGAPTEDDAVSVLQEQLAELEITVEEKRELVEEKTQSLDEARQNTQSFSDKLDVGRGELQTMRGRHASLEALQQAALGEKNKSVSEWLGAQGLTDKPRVAESVAVQDGWDNALETVLGNTLQAVCVDSNADSVAALVGGLSQGELVLLDSKAQVSAANSTISAPLLASKVSASWDVQGLLSGVYICEALNDALSLRASLSAGESIITRDGLWISPHWIKVSRDVDASAGVIARRKELETLTQKIETSSEELDVLSESLQKNRDAIKTLEQERENTRRDVDTESRRHSEVRSSLSALQAKVEQMTMRRTRLSGEMDDAQAQMEQEAEQLSEARVILSDAIASMEKDTEQREQLLKSRDEIRAQLDAARQSARHDKDKAHELQLQSSSLKTQLESIRLSISRLQEHNVRLVERREQLSESLSENQDPAEENKMELESALAKKLVVDEELVGSRRLMGDVDQELREAEQLRNKAEQDVQMVRSNLESERLSAQTYEIKRAALAQQLADSNFDLETLIENLPDDLEIAPLEEELERIASRISRLGAINLAAIDEYKTESERKNYLDVQNADLADALETLQNAITKIDRETRTRFKETFDKVNTGLQELFPKVFGGGHANLELTGDDLLDTGVAIMAQPPGKRNSTIHLLSGGEKALTAIALVFSIFRLNPAPFCMLDEVDAPLDDANVGRYAKLVEEMSKHVQFIYITHNKIAMEMAHQLMGVTMHEAGVSRLVSVDVEEAAELAAM